MREGERLKSRKGFVMQMSHGIPEKGAARVYTFHITLKGFLFPFSFFLRTTFVQEEKTKGFCCSQQRELLRLTLLFMGPTFEQTIKEKNPLQDLIL